MMKTTMASMKEMMKETMTMERENDIWFQAQGKREFQGEMMMTTTTTLRDDNDDNHPDMMTTMVTMMMAAMTTMVTMN